MSDFVLINSYNNNNYALLFTKQTCCFHFPFISQKHFISPTHMYGKFQNFTFFYILIKLFVLRDTCEYNSLFL